MAVPVADVERVERVLAALLQAELLLLEGAGHVPWLDDPATIGECESGDSSPGEDEPWPEPRGRLVVLVLE